MPEDWKSQGACRSSAYDPAWWFPEQRQQLVAERARSICKGVCVVREECLAYALENHLPGIWGGTSERERKRLRRKDRLSVEPFPAPDPEES
jgi:WhiB family redox-sensing transcriptional regulator